jgi:hypothetical protein
MHKVRTTIRPFYAAAMKQSQKRENKNNEKSLMMGIERKKGEPAVLTTWSQSTICCSESTSSLPVARKCAPSSAPDALNDQQEPHEPYKSVRITSKIITLAIK